MENKNINWKAFILPFDDRYHDSLQQQHHAAQFIALVGHHLIPKQPDDSNTNIRYIAEKELLVGNELANGLKVGLHLRTLELYLLDKEFTQTANIALNGKTKKQGFEELKLALTKSGVNISNFKDELHYDIPAHPVVNGEAFSIKNSKYFKENALLFHNSETILNAVVADYKGAAPVRVWPHHFDTGTFIPLSYNNSGEMSRSIGLGMAIPDSMVAEPYFYLSFWSADSTENINNVDSLEIGEWKTPGWSGAVLPLSEILNQNSAISQYNTVTRFFNSGINILTKKFN